MHPFSLPFGLLQGWLKYFLHISVLNYVRRGLNKVILTIPMPGRGGGGVSKPPHVFLE